MEAKDFLEEIDYYNTNVEGQLYEELGIETLADMLELYHERKLKLLGISDVSQQRELLLDFWMNLPNTNKNKGVAKHYVDEYLNTANRV